jgi:hypothetical protein
MDCAMTESALRHRIRPDGPWRVVLPGVYVSNRGSESLRQRAAAAYLYAGPGLAVSGAAALDWHGIRPYRGDNPHDGGSDGDGGVDVLVRLDCRRRNVGFARLHRTGVVPNVAHGDGAVRYAPPARAIADTVRQLPDLTEVRAVVAAGVQQGKVHLRQLMEELDRGPSRGSARLRRALAEVAGGVRSTTESDLVSLVKRHRLPMPLLNPRLFVGADFLASPDAWWPEVGVAAEVDSREWHLSPADWARTMARHALMSSHGIIVLHYPPSRIRAAGRVVADEIRATLAAARGRPLLPIRADPAR